MELSKLLVQAATVPDSRIIVSMPPQHGKSELISRWTPVWYLNRWPHRRLALCSYGASLAAMHGGWVRDRLMAEQDRLRVRLRTTSRASDEFYTTADGGMVCVGVGGPLTGKNYDLGIIDDPIKNREEADSERVRESVRSWYTSTFYTRRKPGASIVILMTRWHEDDLCGWLEREAKDGGDQWTILRLPALAEDGDPLGRSPGDALCPWRYPADALARTRRAIGSRDWISLYQQRPSPEEGEIFKRQWWQRYRPEQLLPMDVRILSVDATFKDTKDADYVSIQLWGRRGPDMYLLDQHRERMAFGRTVDAIRAMLRQHGDVQAVLIEDKANGSAIIDTLKHEVPGIIPVNPQGGKVARAWSVQPLLESCNVWIPEDGAAEWVGDFLEEACAFPNGRKDDQVDAATQALSYLRKFGTSLSAAAGAPRIDFKRGMYGGR